MTTGKTIALTIQTFVGKVKSLLFNTLTRFVRAPPTFLKFEHELESPRELVLGRKVMTKLDSILKSRDITVPTKVHLVKAMVFPVVMHGCESWAIKKAEH